jgi:hypothetical protein
MNKKLINRLCRIYGITDYIINDDMSIDVTHSIRFNGEKDNFAKFTQLPLKFNKANASFACLNNGLQALKGCPKIINGYFNCGKNNLTSLKYHPSVVGGIIACHQNHLTDLNGITQIINSDFFCQENKLTNLYPVKEVNGDLYCMDNKLVNFENFPVVSGNLYAEKNNIRDIYSIPKINRMISLSNNPVYILIQKFIGLPDKWNWIEFFNDCDIIRDSEIIWDRLVFFYDYLDIIIDKEWENSISNYYSIIK